VFLISLKFSKAPHHWGDMIKIFGKYEMKPFEVAIA
jgi:hypothetical protein